MKSEWKTMDAADPANHWPPSTFQADCSHSQHLLLWLFSDWVMSSSFWPHGHTMASLSFTISRSLLKLMFMELVMPSNHLIPCHRFFLLTSLFPSIKVFSNELALCIRWPKYWSLSLNEYSGLISFRIDQFYFLVVQETLRSLLQYHNLKASILQCSAFFMKHITSHKNQ